MRRRSALGSGAVQSSSAAVACSFASSNSAMISTPVRRSSESESRILARDGQAPSFQLDAAIIMYRNDFHRDHRLAGFTRLLRLDPVDQLSGCVGSAGLP